MYRGVRELIVVLFVALLFAPVLQAFEQTDIETASGAEISAALFKGEGQHLVLWLPSERGMRGEYQQLAQALAKRGMDVWALDLHGSFMVPESRSSLDLFDRQDLLSLINHARTKGFERLTFMSSGRGSALALELSEQWQRDNPAEDFLSAHIMFTPYLLESNPLPGDAAVYKPLVHRSNLPVYLIQPEYSTKFARSREIADTLATGGSQVYTQLLKGVVAGFHVRSAKDLSEKDLQARNAIAGKIASALTLMGRTEVPPLPEVDSREQADSESSDTYQGQTLRKYSSVREAAELELPSLYGGRKSLQDYSGKVVLLNFWASWCGPCVKEIPSLSRLAEILEAKDFEVVTVNIGEDEQHIRDFVRDLPVNFEILMDQDSQSVRDWHVYAYPTNFLLNREGKLTHAYRGALEWDSPEVIDVITGQL